MKKEELKKMIIDEIENYLKNNENLKIKDIKILLYNYNKYKNYIKVLNQELENINNGDYILVKNSSDNLGVDYSKVYKTELDILEDTREKIENKIKKLNFIVNKLKNALSIIESDENFKIITLKYFEKKSEMELLKELHISRSAFYRLHNMLLNELKSVLFL